MSTAKVETEQTVSLFDRISVLEDIAERVAPGDRARLIDVIRSELESSPLVRPSAAAAVLQLSEKTVRAWIKEGVLPAATDKPRVLIDASMLHTVVRAVNYVRAAGETRTLIDAVHRQLVDATWLEREDLAESLEQMRNQEGTVRIKKDG